MKIDDNYSDNNDSLFQTVLRQTNVPVFQNKVYPSVELALVAEKGEVELVQSLTSGLIFNKAFTFHKMNYDIFYQNEQGNSAVFKNHLSNVLNLLNSFGIKNKRVIEIGTGKGVFFEMMLENGIDCWGFDPTYEGSNERIKKEYFDGTQMGITADVIIMRHTLEHISRPFSFLHTIAKANDYKGLLFVEVPTFDWIIKKNTFWDIFYEHCNYFTEESLGVMFDNPITGSFFNGQYIYLWAALNKLRNTIPENVRFSRYDASAFNEKLKKYKEMLNDPSSFCIWGAGAKGSTFVNLLGRESKAIQYLIDINPAKQHKFIACTAHPIHHPQILLKQPVQNILVMNENYADEIKEQVKSYNISSNTISL